MNDKLLFRVSVKMKETDKRKNATVRRYVVLAETLDEAKVRAVAAVVDREDATYYHARLEDVAEVWGHSMGVLAYNADIYGEKDKREKPETVPTLDAVRAAQAEALAFEQAYDAAHPEEETK